MKPAVKCLDMEDLKIVSECLQAVYEDAKLGREGLAYYWDAESWDAMMEMVITAASVCGIVLTDNDS